MVDDRLVEVEPFVEHDAKMDSWVLLQAGLPTLGRIHSLLKGVTVSDDGRSAPAANNIEPQDVIDGTLRAPSHIRQWDTTPAELQVAAAADALAYSVHQAQVGFKTLPRQLVHGDYWDNNVFFREGRIVHIADLDFMGERARIDDLALTLYYTNSTFADDQVSDTRIRQLLSLVNAYDSGLSDPLTGAERAALPIALARAALTFIVMIPAIDSIAGAREMVAGMQQDIAWALAIMGSIQR